MTPSERTRGTRVELLGRDDLPKPVAGRRDSVEARLADLASAGAIAAFDVSSWPRRLPREGSRDAAVRDRFLAFEAWATERGVDLRPFFGTRECYSMETGERGEWVVLPALCLAVSDGDELVAVYPHAAGDSYRSVADGLRSLERGFETESADSAPPTTAD